MPHALIVDDSKTARYALRLLLDKQHFTTDMVESAEEALDYLHSQAPDLIFMDHMMPGMDGFQAVKAIKSNSATAAIPIVMYTSTQGGVYFGQARALGAADVISKPASAEDLNAVLQRLADHKLLGPKKAAPAPESKRAVVELEPQPEAEVKKTPAAPVQPISTVTPSPILTPPPVDASRWPAWLTTSCIAAAVVLAVLYLGSLNRAFQLDKQRALAFKTVEWAINRAQEFPYGEPPFGGDRLPLMQELVQQLMAAGFKGKIRLESHVGEFCLLRQPNSDNSGVILAPAPPEMHLTDCTSLGQTTEQSKALSAAQSAGFKRFLSELPDGIEVELVPLGASEPRYDYPSDPSVRAGSWNQVAQHNQRVQIVLQPADL